MTSEILATVQRLREARSTFAVATVIAVRGSASAKPGSKAIISVEGKNLLGWIGGGCAETFVCQQAVEAMQERRVRMVTADLDDEVFGLGMPCGGVMDICIEPVLPEATLYFHAVTDPHLPLAQKVAWLAHRIGMRVVVAPRMARSEPFAIANAIAEPPDVLQTGDILWSAPRAGSLPHASNMAQALLELAHLLIHSRQVSGRPLVEVRGLQGVADSGQFAVEAPQLLILGHSRITEELAQLGHVLEWPVWVASALAERSAYPFGTRLSTDSSTMPFGPNAIVVIASHHRGDPESIERALTAQSAYVGLVASPKRAALVSESVRRLGFTALTLERVRAPAGLAMSCQSPAEIALSIVAETLRLNRAVSG